MTLNYYDRWTSNNLEQAFNKAGGPDKIHQKKSPAHIVNLSLLSSKIETVV